MWGKYKLGEICLNITDGKHGDCKPQVNSGYYFLSAKDILDGKLNFDDAREITEEDFLESHKRTKLEVGDVLITNSGTIGRMAMVRDGEKEKRTTFQKSVAIVKPNKDAVNPLYLYYHLLSKKREIVNSAGGTTQQNLLLKDIRSFEINIPESTEEQRKLASILSSLDDKIELILQMNKTLEAIAQAIFKEWFVDFRFPGFDGELVDGLPRGWNKCTIGSCTENVQYGYTQSSINEEIGPKFLRITDIQKGVVDWDQVPFCLIEEKELEKYIIKDHDIFVARTGASTGENIYIIEPPIAVFASYLIRLQFKCPELAFYIGKFMRRQEYFNYISASIGGSAQPNANAKTLTNIVIVIPEREILKEYFDLVFPLHRRVVRNQMENQVLAKLRDSLLPKLMTGKIRVG